MFICVVPHDRKMGVSTNPYSWTVQQKNFWTRMAKVMGCRKKWMCIRGRQNLRQRENREGRRKKVLTSNVEENEANQHDVSKRIEVQHPERVEVAKGRRLPWDLAYMFRTFLRSSFQWDNQKTPKLLIWELWRELYMYLELHHQFYAEI